MKMKPIKWIMSAILCFGIGWAASMCSQIYHLAPGRSPPDKNMFSSQLQHFFRKKRRQISEQKTHLLLTDLYRNVFLQFV